MFYNKDRSVEYTSIDFDDAHNHWIQNKRKLSNGMYRYICVGFFKNGNQCNRNPLVGKNTCKIHDFPQNIAPIKDEETKTNCDEDQDQSQDQEDTYNTLIVRTPERGTSVVNYGVMAMGPVTVML